MENDIIKEQAQMFEIPSYYDTLGNKLSEIEEVKQQKLLLKTYIRFRRHEWVFIPAVSILLLAIISTITVIGLARNKTRTETSNKRTITKVLPSSNSSENQAISSHSIQDSLLEMDPEDWGYKKVENLEQAEKEVGHKVKVPEFAKGSEVKNVYTGISRAGTQEVNIRFGNGIAFSQWLNPNPTDYKAIIAQTEELNKDASSSPDGSTQEAEGLTDPKQYPPSWIDVNGVTVSIWPSDKVQSVQWDANGYTYTIASDADKMPIADLVKLAEKTIATPE